MPTPERINFNNETSEENNDLLTDKKDSIVSRASGRTIGAKLLSLAGFKGRHTETVENSFDRARKHGEKLHGNNDERRTEAYLLRLEKGIEAHGNRYERKIWEATEKSLIVDSANIPENYWKTQKQILRDEGYGDINLGEREKAEHIKNIQEQQRESIESWTNYLSHEDCPYPTWFKVYTIDGVSKMGVFDKRTSTFKKRDKGTVAPYPHFDAATLGKVYDTITDFYGINPKTDLVENSLGNELGQERNDEANEEDAIRNAELGALVKSGNFNKLYSRLLISEKLILKTPEKTEDIKGEWVKYVPGDEEELAKAADGTPWCIVSPNMGHHYLGEDDENNEAKFLLFHLYDRDGRIADNACASIRLDKNGNVAEISGLKDGQALEDSMVPLVEEKVRTLPGGKKFLKRFADKKHLIEIDRKMKAGEDIDYEDFRFIYELDRSIATLDTYNDKDPRIREFRKTYGSEYAAERCWINRGTKISDVNENLERYLKNDLDLSSNLMTYVLKKQFETEPEKVQEMFSRVNPDHVSEMMERLRNFETLETEHFVFMLPKDRWDKNKIELPENEEGRFVAPENLTAILKTPMNYDWKYETNGERNAEISLIFGEKYVGREVRHFPFCKELFLAEEKLLEPNGYHIPKDWKEITNSIKNKIANEKQISSDEEKNKDTIDALIRELNIPLDGHFSDILFHVGLFGYYWSSVVNNSTSAYVLCFTANGDLYPPYSVNRANGFSVRCVAR